MIEPFTARIPQAEVDDLQQRLAMTRWAPEQPPGTEDGAYGVPLSRLRRLVSRWEKFDWRRWEDRLNAYPQFRTSIDGQPVHFLHVRSAVPGALPVVLSHGWPGSVFEYVDLIHRLTDPAAHGGEPADAFHVVLPSLPGYGFSGPAREPGWGTRRIAAAWAELMASLGYQRYGAIGNDAGSMISPELGRLAPERVVGVHVTQLFSFPGGDPAELADLDADEQAAMEVLSWFWQRKGAFNVLQGQQPQTLAHALADSPAGLLGWNAQLFDEALDDEFVLANVTLYWLTGTAWHVDQALLREHPRDRAGGLGPDHGPDRAGGGGRRRLPVDPPFRRPRPRPHHVLERAARRDRALQRPHQPGRARRRHPPLLPPAPPGHHD